MSNELSHHGIKGQKWGRRRYQNKDGSLTPAGKQRYGSEENFESRYDEDVKAGIRATKKLADGGKDLTRATKEYEGERSRKKQQKANKALEEAVRDRARSMSDQELRDAVQRLNMEECNCISYRRSLLPRLYRNGSRCRSYLRSVFEACKG